MEDLTIQGEVFKEVYSPSYQAGHQINEVEAEVLNQTERENLRNNFARKVKEAKEKEGGTLSPETFAALQSELKQLAENYQFNVRQPRQSDPIMAIAMELVLNGLHKSLKAQGVKVKDIPAADLKAKAKAMIDANPVILEKARARFEEDQKLLASLV
jgi:hypothetical protein